MIRLATWTFCAVLAATAAWAQAPQTAVATFAGGCFWCTEADFDKVAGVISTTSGYTGGTTVSPTYEQVSAGGTGHAEAVEIVYDPTKVSYRQLLDVFWHSIDPTVKDRQFCDVGHQYRTAIFYRTEEERKLAEESRAQAEKQLGQKVHTEIAPAGAFYKAEDYHQDFHIRNPTKYKFYRWNCGRDQRLEQIWGSRKSS
jgi:peptide-methionine (S)-S-oxide reductase